MAAENDERYDYNKWENRRDEWEQLKNSSPELQDQWAENKYAYNAQAEIAPPSVDDYGNGLGEGLETGGKTLQGLGMTALAASPLVAAAAPVTAGAALAPAAITAIAGGSAMGLGTVLEAIGSAVNSKDEDAYNAAMDQYNMLIAQKETAWLEQEGRRTARKEALASLRSDTSIYS